MRFLVTVWAFLGQLVLSALAENRGGSLWPEPEHVLSFAATGVISPDLKIVSNLPGCDVLNQAIDRYSQIIQQLECASIDKSLFKPSSVHPTETKRRHRGKQYDKIIMSGLNITVNGACDVLPSDSMDETYTITACSETAEMSAISVWGAIRGLETFSQLIWEDIDNGEVELVINCTVIEDAPRFSFRGLHIDTSRHFIPVSVLLENLEAMAQNKLNVFHWHIVDDQSFPYESKTFPGLSAKGAFSKNHVYTQEQIAEVIEFARVRGIRVIPEFDSPGHTQSWGKDQTNLLTPCYKDGKPDGTFGPIDPINDQTYDFLTTFLSEVAQVFPDKYLHLGGDEVSFDCWQSNPDILSFMKSRGISGNFSRLEEFYEQRLVDIVQKQLYKGTLVWQEVFDNQVQVNKETVVHVWKDPHKEELAKVTQAGYRTILSTCWYLNYISYGNDWAPYYACDPQDFDGTDSQKDLVIGGAAAMWAEFVDGTQMMSRTWPRASAAAERLWSPKNVTDVNLAIPRMDDHRCRMLKRGLRVQPTVGPGFCECDPFV